MDPYGQGGGDAYGQGSGNPRHQEEDIYDEEEKSQSSQWAVSYSSDTSYHQQQSYSQQPQDSEARPQYPSQYHQHQHDRYQEYQQHQQYHEQYEQYQQQSYPQRPQQGTQQYSQYGPAAQQPYESQAQAQAQAQEDEAEYDTGRVAYSMGSYQARAVDTGGSSYQYPSINQHLVSVGAGVMPPTAEEHRQLTHTASGYADTYTTTESLTSDPTDYNDQDWTEEEISYASPIDYDSLPPRASREEKTRKKAERMAKDSLERYRKRMKGDEDYKKKKEELLSKINEELKRDADQLRKQKAVLLKELKKHDHRDPNCQCNVIHQYLYFTQENKYVTREEAFELGWLGREDLELLQCRSPDHSPDVSRSGSGKSSYGPGNSGGSGSGSGGGGYDDEIKTEEDDEGGVESWKRSSRHEGRRSGGGGKEERHRRDSGGGKHGKKSSRKGNK